MGFKPGDIATHIDPNYSELEDALTKRKDDCFVFHINPLYSNLSGMLCGQVRKYL